MDEISNTFYANIFEKHLEKNIGNNASQLQIIQSIKNISSNSLGCMNIQALLDHTLNFQKEIFENIDNTCLFQYGKLLINALVLNNFFENKFILHFELILLELEGKDLRLKEKLIIFAWQKFKKHNFNNRNIIQSILKLSETFFEKVVLDWLEKGFQIDYYVMLSSNIPEVFQLISVILHEILKISKGSQKVLSLISSFIEGVIFICQNERKNFLKLYPGEYSWLVGLIVVPPHIHFLKSKKVNLILHLIFNEFHLNRSKISLLLSHFPQWIPVFKNFLISYDKK